MERREAGDVESVGCFGGFAPRRKLRGVFVGKLMF
jgi:hypothetical protein